MGFSTKQIVVILLIAVVAVYASKKWGAKIGL